jgi:hypothetical protein
MNFRCTTFVILSIAVFVLVGLNAEAGDRRVPRGRKAPVAGDGTAYAALQPVGTASGWGRIVVHDDEIPGGVLRRVDVWLHGMDPRTEYLVVVDDVEIGTITTRPNGSGHLKLKDFGSGQGLVPTDLPPAAELESTTVFGPSLETALEGTFSSIYGHHPGTTYEEEIALEEANASGALGMAKVEMKHNGHQEFKTRASHLEPGETYSVVLDGLVVAYVTADDQGQAHLHLEDPDDDNPIPEELLPVSDIRTVEWFLGVELILSGSFDGTGFCEELAGTVSEVTAEGFTLETRHGSVDVVTSPDTEWKGFDDHVLAVGDSVKVDGCWNDEVFVAYVVEHKGRGHEESCDKLVGTVTNVSGEAFILVTPRLSVTVMTTPETEWEGFDEPLSVDDRVKVNGCWEDEDFIAYVVKLLEDDDDDGETGALCTQGMGGWGQQCHGNNVGCLRDAYFDVVFPNGVCLGDNWDSFGADPDDSTPENESCTDGPEGGYSIYLSSSAAVAVFAVQGGKPAVFTSDLTDPVASSAGVFTGQLLAAVLNVGFDAAGIGLCTLAGSCDFQFPPGTLGALIYGDCTEEELEGMSVLEVIALANGVISGVDEMEDVGAGDLKDALEELNEAFEDCDPGESDCLMLP